MQVTSIRQSNLNILSDRERVHPLIIMCLTTRYHLFHVCLLEQFYIILCIEVTTNIGDSASALINAITVITTITGQFEDSNVSHFVVIKGSLTMYQSSLFTDFSQR